MRLYKRHDLDLLCLYKQKECSLQNIVKAAVLAYLSKSDAKIEYPACASPIADLPSTAQFHLHLSPADEKEREIIECIAKIPNGFKNSFLKNTTRYHLSTPTTFTLVDKTITINTTTKKDSH